MVKVRPVAHSANAARSLSARYGEGGARVEEEKTKTAYA